MINRDIIIKDLKSYYSEAEFIELTNLTFDNINNDELNLFFQKHCEKYKTVVNIQDLTEKYDNSLFLVNTPDGYIEANTLYIKEPQIIYNIKTSEYNIRCSENHEIETPTGWQFAKNINKGDLVLTKTGYQEVIYVYKNANPEITYDLEIMSDTHRYWGGTGISSHNCAKSYLAVSVCREAQKMGYTPIVLDSEGAYDSEFVRRLGADPSKLIIKQVNTITETSKFIANLCKKLQEQEDKYGSHDKVLIVLDSLGNLTSEKERDDTLSGNQKRDMTKQQEIKAMFRVNATPIARLQIPWVVISHVYASMNMFSPGNVVSGGSGIIYNSSLTIELFKSKLVDKENDDNAAKQGGGKTSKNGILVTAKPQKSRFCITRPVQFAIPWFKAPSPYVGIEQYLTWDNAGVCRGSMLTEKEYNKLSDADKNKSHSWESDGVTYYCIEKDTARGIICKRLNRQVSFVEFFSDIVFTQDYLEYINEHVIHPAFQLPDHNSFDDIKDIEDSLELGPENDSDPIAEANV